MSKAGDVIFAESKVNCEANVMAETNTPERLETAQQDTPAFLLVGGLGTRLQSVLSSTPKPLARVGKMPFLELLVLQLRSQGIRQHRDVYRAPRRTDRARIRRRQEMGRCHRLFAGIATAGNSGSGETGGSYLKQASDFLVMNGDSFLELDLRQFIQFHREHGGIG